MPDPIKVLIVDDNVNMRVTLKNLLFQFDCVFDEAESGEEAFAKISRKYFDVVFFDNKLPGDDGVEIIRKIRELKIQIGKIFFITGYPEINTKLEAEKLDVYCFLRKDKMNFSEMQGLFKRAVGLEAIDL